MMNHLQKLEEVRQCLHEDTGDFSVFLEIVNDNSIMYYVGNNLPFSGTYIDLSKNHAKALSSV